MFNKILDIVIGIYLLSNFGVCLDRNVTKLITFVTTRPSVVLSLNNELKHT